ncbi:MAG: Gfo/Idh/MocA family oxidoreductase [candidate division KSB1 bacterium]|nr:Gfo/Idh/MocA family oxidoreductase [candidate division KSB1 bacterium]MDZ7303894.1 Gfo/Idh/MocA family oxidoreductase [candidate division KSB1 bacterium]MDZ7313182.1 Gfo/Idh/MocA family oxidoreductase [candidate division KSB1 bacterium]
MHNDPIRLGVVGCGLATKNLHWPALRNMTDKFRIVAVCNHTPEKAREFAQMVGLDKFETDYRRLLDSPEIEAVLVALPINKNAEVTRNCLAAGKHVLCEKPLAHTLEEAKALRDFAGQSPQVLLVGENYYYRDDFNDALALIRNGRIGQIYLITYEATSEIDHTQSYGATLWRQQPAHRGGFVSDAGVHHAAALRMFGGDIRAVHAFAKNIHPLIRAEDNLVANLEFTSGAIGQYCAIYTAKAFRHGTRLCIHGTEGSIEITHGELTCFNPKLSTTVEARHYPDFDNGFRNEWLAFYHAIRDGQPPTGAAPAGVAATGVAFPSTANQCYTDQVVIMAMLDSAARREMVSLQ